jgi:hypothetical protein
MVGLQLQAPVAPHATPVTSSTQLSPVQQACVVLQVWPVPEQLAVAHAPLTQARPVQQSLVAVQAPRFPTQTLPTPHLPNTHVIEQHCDEAVQVAPLASQRVPASVMTPPSGLPSTMPPSGSTPASGLMPVRHTPPMHAAGAQQSALAMHVEPAGLHVGSTHWMPPSPPGTHLAPSQHCPLNWQRLPSSMQQSAPPSVERWPV